MPPIRPGQKTDRTTNLSQNQLEIMKASIDAAAKITASMVGVTNEKNPAKISEAFKTIYKAIQEAIKA